MIASRNRPDDLRRVLQALAAQATSRHFEVVVVDDGSEPPVRLEDWDEPPTVRLLRGAGRGPAEARNLGVAFARGVVIAFTDDDTIPNASWLEAVLDHLNAHPECVGVEGPIHSLPYDRAREISLDVRSPGAYYTANVAYRRTTLDAVGRFRPELFPMHCEDIDLAFRALDLGPIGFAPGMTVEHVPRPISLVARARRGRMVWTELALQREHRQRYGRGGRLPGPLFVLANAIQVLAQEAAAQRVSLARHPGRAARFIVYALLHLCYVVGALARRPGSR